MTQIHVSRVKLLAGSLLFALIAALAPATSLSDTAQTPIYLDVTDSSGLKSLNNYAYDVTGQAWGDVDNDGLLDLYTTDAAGSNRLYHNNGNNTFSVHPFASAVALPLAESAGAVFADYNNDGWVDLYVLNDGPNALFRNDSGTGFTDVASTVGVADPGMGTSAAWGDVNSDGLLDLYVANFMCQSCATGSDDALYLNNGIGGFADIRSALPGLGSRPVEHTFVASFLDYDNDGDLDIYAVYDHQIGNDLWRNDGPGCGSWCFTRVSASAGADTQVDGMGLAIGDYDRDGDLDMYFTHTGPVGVLLQNQTSQGSPTFVDATIASGLNHTGVGWGAAFIDYDNDASADLYVATSIQLNATNLLYHGNGNTFSDVSAGCGADDPGNTHGMAYADYDNDGWLDLIIGNQGDGYYLYENLSNVGSGNAYLDLELVGDAAAGVNRDAIGARAYVYTSDGRVQMQEVKSGSSLGAGNQMRLHFGLGSASLDLVCVIWPDGTNDCRNGIAANQLLTWPFDSATDTDEGREAANLPLHVALFQNVPNPFNPATTISFALSTPEKVELRVFDLQGHLVRSLFSGYKAAGRHNIVWTGDDGSGRQIASGVYMVRLTTSSDVQTRKMIMVR
jgi:hypothetical protein